MYRQAYDKYGEGIPEECGYACSMAKECPVSGFLKPFDSYGFKKALCEQKFERDLRECL